MRVKSANAATLAGQARDFKEQPSVAERREKGRSLRESVARESHSAWNPPKDRRDPVEITIESEKGRLPELVPIRHERMSQSAFGFLRGSAAVMAADLAHTPNSGINVQICGDCHLLNFGGFVTPERNQIFDIHDFDETARGPWKWDLKRLVASMVVAGRHIGLDERDSVRAARAAVRGYRERMAEYSHMHVLDVWYDKIDLPKVVEELPNEELRERVKNVSKKRARERWRSTFFPNLSNNMERLPSSRIIRRSSTIFALRRSRPNTAERSTRRLPTTANRWQKTIASCSTAFAIATWR